MDPKLWKRLYAYAWRNKKTFIMTIVCLLYVALADSLYPLLANYAVDSFIIPGKSDGVWLFLIVYVALAFSQGFGTLGFITRCGKMEMTISYDIRQDGFLKLQNQSFSYFDKTAVGYLMARMISDVSRLSEMVAWSMVDLLWSSCYALLCLIIMLIKNWKLALLVLVVVPPLAIVAFFMERAI
ncbi:MAG: ABC transporter ATP-binding protein, partial [Clostridia bacterium]|nr:ABC transporter ATP-binding protein [Clostridia bacterium]